MILGIDEVGRGPWAGPLVIGAVVLGDATIDGLTDSKKLSKKRRNELDVLIREQASAYGLGWVHADEIDKVGLSESLRLATKRAVEQITTPYHEIIIDGTINFLKDTSKGKYVTTIAKADLLVPSVSAASIIAKVARDNYMTEQEEVYKGYGFGAHVGYGTQRHRDAIEELGVTPLHRLSFAPLKKYAPNAEFIAIDRDAPLITSKVIGDKAENFVADYLAEAGHVILERNWRTKFCEIDIISRKADTIYFTEVKYRRQSNQGGGLAAITPKKLQQMKFAAEYFSQTKMKKAQQNLLLSVAAVTGDPLELEQYIILQ
jgi:ribonuclease HII